MCRQCKKKSTPTHKSSRLSDAQIKKIALFFWQEISAEEASKQLALNRKTIQRYYRLIRQSICNESDMQIYSFYGLNKMENSGTNCLRFHIAHIDGYWRIIDEDGYSAISATGARLEPAYLLYSNNQTDDSRLKSNDLMLKHLAKAAPRDSAGLDRFIQFLSKKLSQLKTAQTENFYSYLKEIEFRFNQPAEHESLDYLISIATNQESHCIPRRNR